ncbi:hypothetical protein RSOLAG1IB_00771 [Rhizoctonia solani AG-1 IB]|uniref:Uncharacterized protein n=1 Tax=Thanatephorus cucumeris (strain AG1-IB / isolate 7/3/14) TaxID=1108050 RepID=A0A0B7F7M2_THACB|nr:hypothetical protein RSOLAG1IB_00771 [Rhizoctonia solani AG-1 IB]
MEANTNGPNLKGRPIKHVVHSRWRIPLSLCERRRKIQQGCTLMMERWGGAFHGPMSTIHAQGLPQMSCTAAQSQTHTGYAY